jgi:hypothetical protein
VNGLEKAPWGGALAHLPSWANHAKILNRQMASTLMKKLKLADTSLIEQIL